jgi:hypothetical protein
MPPLEVSERQIIVGPNYPSRIEGGRVLSLKVPPGRYDIGALVSSLPADQKPELTLVLADAFQQCVPANLAAVPGRKLLLAADTHHGQNPLQKLLAYARQEPFDQIVVIHDPHHLHWFKEAAIAPTLYVPNVNVHHFPQTFNERRQAKITFVGQAGKFHPRRRNLLDAIAKSGLPLGVQQAPAPAAAGIYNAAQITFNCSLNGDLNMRVFEVMAAGGFLVTDRLSPQSGLDVHFRPGEDYVDYDGLDDLIAKLKHYLARPRDCLEIARSGQSAYLKSHTPAQRIRDLLDVANGAATASYAADRRAVPGEDGFGQDLAERVRLYEVMQSFAQQVEQISVVVDAAVGARCIADFVDLPRLKIHVAAAAGQLSSVRESLLRLGALGQVDLFEGPPRPCDVVVMDGRTMNGLGDAQSLRTRFLLVRDNGDGLAAGKTSWLADHGFKKLAEKPWVFERMP